MLWLASLLIVFILLTAPNKRPASFLFFMVTVNHSLSHVLSSNAAADASNAFLSVRGKTKIRNSLDNARLTVFARNISFAFIGHSADHDICFSLWQTAQRLRGAGDIPAHVSVL
jgi:hypothetical protein